MIEALHRAVGRRQLEPETLLIHTDQSSQYRATDYRDLLGKHEIVCSMSAKQGLLQGQRGIGEFLLHTQAGVGPR